MKIEGNKEKKCVNILLVSVISHHCQTKKIRLTDRIFGHVSGNSTYFKPYLRLADHALAGRLTRVEWSMKIAQITQ